MQSLIVVPTYGTWPTTPRIAQAPWSQGVPFTRYVVGKGIQLQDASDLTTGRAAWQAQIRRSQRGRDRWQPEIKSHDQSLCQPTRSEGRSMGQQKDVGVAT